MKLVQGECNPLQQILEVFPEATDEYLEYEQLQIVKEFLWQGGVICENYEEVVTCLQLLDQMGLLKCEQTVIDNNIQYKVTKKKYV